jgi:hypothetical protein
MAHLLNFSFLLSFICKVLADTFRAFLKDRVDETVVDAVFLSTVISDILQVFVIYYFVMNVGALKVRFLSESEEDYTNRLHQH